MIVEVIRGLDMGGAETLLYTRLRYRASQQDDDVSDTVVVNTLASASIYTERLRALGVRVIELQSANPFRSMVELRRVVKELRADVVVFHSPSATYLEKLRRMLRLRSPRMLVDVVHSTRYRGTYRLLGALLDRFADRAIAVSDDVAASPTTAHYRQVRTVMAGVDLDRMRQWVLTSPDAPMLLRASLGIPGSRRVVVTVGSLILLKGHRYAVAALAEPGLEDIALVLVGSGAERDALQQLASELGVADRVHFAGRVDDAWQWTAVADAIVHPSAFEGLPVAMMEAAALGTPIVATDVGGMGRIAETAELGQLIATPDAALIARALRTILQAISPIQERFPTRAEHSSYWSIRRYADEFSAAVEPPSSRRST